MERYANVEAMTSYLVVQRFLDLTLQMCAFQEVRRNSTDVLQEDCGFLSSANSVRINTTTPLCT